MTIKMRMCVCVCVSGTKFTPLIKVRKENVKK